MNDVMQEMLTGSYGLSNGFRMDNPKTPGDWIMASSLNQ